MPGHECEFYTIEESAWLTRLEVETINYPHNKYTCDEHVIMLSMCYP